MILTAKKKDFIYIDMYITPICECKKYTYKCEDVVKTFC